jgi:oligopeptide transport system ATP-binding protein
MVGIPRAQEHLGSYPHQFSGGMRQRVMIAIALSCNPRLLIADEATTALDVTIQAQIVELVRTLTRKLGTAVIWISHDLGLVAGLCDRVSVMYAGRIVETGPVREVFYRPSHGYTVGLIGCTPRVDRVGTPLTPINGLPPNLIDDSPLCPFLPRCDVAIPACHQTRPELRSLQGGHFAACLADLSSHHRGAQ